MENASKALLIAAAVLIVILLIGFGMAVFNSTADTSTDATEVGDALETKTDSAADEAYKAIKGDETATRPSQQQTN